MFANSIFTSDAVQELLHQTQTTYITKTNEERVREQEIQYAFYTGNKDEIESILKADLTKYYNKDSKILTILLDWLNITKRFIDTLSVIYLEPAKRYIVRGDTIDETLTEYYNEQVLPLNVNSIDKRANRLDSLQGGSISVFTYDKKYKRFKQKVNSSHLYNVITDHLDSHSINALGYYRDIQNFKQNEVVQIVWTEDEYYMLDSSGNIKPFIDNSSRKNIYGIIPVATFADKQSETFFSEGANDIIQANRVLNSLLTKLDYDDLILGTAGHIFGVDLDNLVGLNVAKSGSANTGLSSREPIREEVQEAITDLKAGRQNIIAARSTRDGAKPTLEYISTNPQVTSVLNAIRGKLKLIAVTRGLNPEVFAEEVRSTSGFSKMIDRLEMSEVRKEDIDKARLYEHERFNTLRTMNNVHYNRFMMGKREMGMEIPDEAKLRVDFGEISNPKTTAEEWMDNENKIKYDLINIYDLIKQYNPDIKTNKDAKKVLKDNSKLNKLYKDLKQVVSQNGSEKPENNINK